MAGVCSGPGPCDTSPTGHGGDNFVTRGGGFDPYLRAIINALKRSGHTESEAVQLAIGIVTRWARGEGNVSAATRARAAKALARWEALKAQAHATPNKRSAGSPAIDAALTGIRDDRPGHVYKWKHGWIPLTHEAALEKGHGNHAVAGKILHANGQYDDAKQMLHAGAMQHAAAGNTELADKYHVAASRVGESPHFRMSSAELRDRAAKGDTEAQAEIDRRAARRTAAGGKAGGHKTGVPFRPTGERPLPSRPAPTPEPTVPAPQVADALAKAREENRRIEAGLPGHKISSKELDRSVFSGPTRLVHTQEDAYGNRVGSVIERPAQHGGGYRASLNGSHIGDFETRAGAHQALAREHDRVLAEEKRKAAETAARDARNAAANSKKAQAVAAGLKGPGGHDWQSFPFESDGTRLGDKAAAKVKQSFRAGDSTVLIETQLSKDQTRALLSDITDSVDKTGVHGVTFRVPSGDGHFRSRSGVVGAYVRQGQRTVHINPKIATGEVAGQFKNSDNFMPANKGTNGRTYTLVHELGHIVDHEGGHTSGSGGHTPSGIGLPPVPRERATALAREHAAELSKYGRTNNAEAYAEAYAQWIHGGPGSSKVADAYAALFGWPRPKSGRRAA